MSNDYLEMAAASISSFADDGKIDAKELGELFDIALRDGIVDDNERRILKNIISKIQPSELDDAMQAKLAQIQKEIG